MTPQSQDELEVNRIILQHMPYQSVHDSQVVSLAKDLLAWRRTTSLDKVPKKREYGPNDTPEVIKQIKTENRIIDLTKKNIEEQL